MEELDIFSSLREPDAFIPKPVISDPRVVERRKKLAEHKAWLKGIRKERPNPLRYQRVAVYIRFFNQTKYENYLDYHKQMFLDTILQCPNWEFVDFYVDEGQTAPRMENAKAWSQLLLDAMSGKVDLIITQKVSNVSRNASEVTFCSRILARQAHPIGIYFVGEDIYTLASYYREDLSDIMFLPSADWELLPEDTDEESEDDE